MSIALTGTERQQSIYIQNFILRKLGFDYALDNGSATIHFNEPDQGVAFVPSAITLVKTFYNTKAEKAEEGITGWYAISRNLWPERNQSIDFIIDNLRAGYPQDHISQMQATADPNVRYIIRLMDYMGMSVINNNYAGQLPANILKTLLDTVSPGIRSKLQVAVNAVKKPRTKKALVRQTPKLDDDTMAKLMAHVPK